MSIRPSGVLAVGAVTGACWVLFVTEAVQLASSAKLVGGVAGLFVIFATTITIWLAMTGREIPWIRDPDQPQQRLVSPRRDEEQEYLRRRAEDARMRELMKPRGQQAPPTDWFGR